MEPSFVTRPRFRRFALFIGILTAGLLGTSDALAFHSSPHSGTYKIWSLNETVGFDPHETQADLANLSNHIVGPVNITAMENGFLPGGPCGVLVWNPVTNEFLYVGVTGGLQRYSTLNESAVLGTPATFGGGDIWSTVNGNAAFAPYVLRRGDAADGSTLLNRWDGIGASNATGIRVNPTTGKAYFGNVFPGQIIELDPVTNAFKKWNVGNNPDAFLIDAAGMVYASAFEGGGFPDQIIRLDPVTNTLTRWTIPGPNSLQDFISFGTPNYLAFDKEGQVWVSETESDEYGRLNPVTNLFEEFTKPAMAGARPHGIATSGAGPTLQLFGEEAHGNTTDVLTHAVATLTSLKTVVTPTMEMITPTAGVAIPRLEPRPATRVTILPDTFTVESTNGSGIDRFPEPPPVHEPTSTTVVLFASPLGGGTIFGSVEGTDDVQQFESTVIFEPGAEAAKVTGGGMYAVPGGAATLGFNVQRKVEDGPVSGQYQYQNHATGENVHSETIDTLVVSDTDADGKPDKAEFSGTCTKKQAGAETPCTFNVVVEDKGEPGRNDTHSINGVVIVPTSGTLSGGNIQIHKSKS